MSEVLEIVRPLASAPSETSRGRMRLGFREIWMTPLPFAGNRRQLKFFNRLTLSVFRNRILSMTGEEIIRNTNHPYVLVANHSTRYEAMVLPGIINHLRQGSPIHFFADWNFALYPLLGHMMRKGEAIIVTRKPARPAFLNLLRPFYTDTMPSHERGAYFLKRGEPVGIFPEGTRNTAQDTLLRGERGAAWLSLSENVPILPVGIRYPLVLDGQPVAQNSPMELEFGNLIHPDSNLIGKAHDLDALKQWHARIMTEISRLSGKQWNPSAKRKKI